MPTKIISPTLRIFTNNELAICLLPLENQPTAEDEICRLWPQEDNSIHETPVLVIYQTDQAASPGRFAFDFFGLARQQQLLKQLASQHLHLSCLSLSSFGSYQRYTDKLSGGSSADNQRPVADLMNSLLVYGRPLSQYGCTFYLPVYADKEIQANDKISQKTYPESHQNFFQQESQAYLFFQPPIRDFLFDTSTINPKNPLKPIKEWHLKNHHRWLWQLQDENITLSADITNVVLYQYFNNLCVLAISVKPENLLKATGDDWWHAAAFGDEAAWENLKLLQMGLWLKFTKLARILFASFKEQQEEHKIARIILKTPIFSASMPPESSQLLIEPIANKLADHPVNHLLKCFFGERANPAYLDENFHHFYDDRMFVNVSYGYCGSQLSKQTANKVFALALYVDTPSDAFCDGYAYDPKFTKALLSRDSNARWVETGTYAGFNHYANAHLGQGYFFCQVIASIHVPYIYGRMLLMTLFYQASLRHYRERLMRLTADLEGEINFEQTQKLRKELLLFTNAYWFHEITSQSQGIEVFNKQQAALGLEQEYLFIREELERLDTYTRNDVSHTINQILYLFAGISLWFTFSQVIFSQDFIKRCSHLTDQFVSSQQLSLLGNAVLPGLQGIAVLFVVVGFFALVYFTTKHLRRFMKKWL
jgi:hypothetical protein